MKSPCLSCELLLADKDCDTCMNCRKRLEYVRSLGSWDPDLPVTEISRVGCAHREVQVKALKNAAKKSAKEAAPSSAVEPAVAVAPEVTGTAYPDLTMTLDFSEYPELLTKIKDHAHRELRTEAAQILWMIRNLPQLDPEGGA